MSPAINRSHSLQYLGGHIAGEVKTLAPLSLFPTRRPPGECTAATAVAHLVLHNHRADSAQSGVKVLARKSWLSSRSAASWPSSWWIGLKNETPLKKHRAAPTSHSSP